MKRGQVCQPETDMGMAVPPIQEVSPDADNVGVHHYSVLAMMEVHPTIATVWRDGAAESSGRITTNLRNQDSNPRVWR